MLPFYLVAVGGYLIWDSQRTSFSEGGEIDLNKFRKKYDKNEQNNYDRENLILLAKTFGDENDVKEANRIISAGYTPSDLAYYFLHDKLWSRYLQIKERKVDKIPKVGDDVRGFNHKFGTVIKEVDEKGKRFKIKKSDSWDSGDTWIDFDKVEAVVLDDNAYSTWHKKK